MKLNFHQWSVLMRDVDRAAIHEFGHIAVARHFNLQGIECWMRLQLRKPLPLELTWVSAEARHTTFRINQGRRPAKAGSVVEVSSLVRAAVGWGGYVAELIEDLELPIPAAFNWGNGHLAENPCRLSPSDLESVLGTGQPRRAGILAAEIIHRYKHLFGAVKSMARTDAEAALNRASKSSPEPRFRVFLETLLHRN